MVTCAAPAMQQTMFIIKHQTEESTIPERVRGPWYADTFCQATRLKDILDKLNFIVQIPQQYMYVNT